MIIVLDVVPVLQYVEMFLILMMNEKLLQKKIKILPTLNV
jgi:hypothetical protein